MTRDETEKFVAELVAGYDMEPEDAAALHEMGKLAALSSPAPPDDLVGLVREWQAARKPVGLEAPGVGVAETYQAAVKRMAAADVALAAFDLYRGSAGER